MALVRAPADRISVALAVVAVAFPLACWWARAPWVWVWAFVVVSTMGHLVEHNHVHQPTFRSPRANLLFDLALMTATGIPPEGYRYQHVEVHHRYLGTTQDWTYRTIVVAPRFRRFFAVLGESLCYLPRAWARTLPVMWSRRRGAKGRRFWLSLAILVGLGLVLLAARPREFVLFFAIPWAGNAVLPGYYNHRHHVDCRFTDPFDQANVRLTMFSGTRLGFHIGFHSVHHAHPSLHWTELRRRYFEDFADHTPPDRVTFGWRYHLMRSNESRSQGMGSS